MHKREFVLILTLMVVTAACTHAEPPATATPLPALAVTPSATRLRQTVTPTRSSTKTPTPVPPTPTVVVDLFNYVQNCDLADRLQNAYERQYMLDQLTFATELSSEAQERLKLPVIVKPSCNVRLGNTPQAVVLHATRGGLDASISEFQDRNSSSAHYIIDRNGQVYQMVPEKLVAFHVTCCIGPGGIRIDFDYTQSIGIELVNKIQVQPDSFEGLIYEDYLESFGYRFWEDYPQEQIDSLVILVEDIITRWDIPWEMVVGHYRVNDNADPGPALNLFWWRYGNPPRAPIFSTP